jgi:UDP-N-acetylglucosamine 2-epimerase
MKIAHVVGARPNFMKVAPVHAALAARGVGQTLIHTGQHYDEKMSDVFFDELRLPRPDVNLNVGSGIACCADGRGDDCASSRCCGSRSRIGCSCTAT